MKKVTVILAFVLGLISCTENTMVKKYGGQGEIELETNERLVNMTFKESSLWVLTKFDSTKPPSTYLFKEKSSFGVLEGTFIIKEK